MSINKTTTTDIGEMIMQIANHAVNKNLKIKRSNGSDLPDKWNKWEERTETFKNNDTEEVITYRTATGFVDSISKDDLVQIAALAAWELYADGTTDEESLFTAAFIAIRREINNTQYAISGRYKLKKKTDKALEEELQKIADETDAIMNISDNAVKTAKEIGVDIYDRTTGPAYNQIARLMSEKSVSLQTAIFRKEKRDYILAHMTGEQRKLFTVYDEGFERPTDEKKSVRISEIRERMHYGDTISRATIFRRVKDMKSAYRNYAAEYDAISGYSDNYSRGLAYRDASKETIQYLSFLAKKPKKAIKKMLIPALVKVNTAYIRDMNTAYINYTETVNPETITAVAETPAEYRPAKRYINPQITSIADVKGWQPKQEKRKNIVPLKTLESVLKKEKDETIRLEIMEYINRHYK